MKKSFKALEWIGLSLLVIGVIGMKALLNSPTEASAAVTFVTFIVFFVGFFMAFIGVLFNHS